jgi:hypothetical protein
VGRAYLEFPISRDPPEGGTLWFRICGFHDVSNF